MDHTPRRDTKMPIYSVYNAQNRPARSIVFAIPEKASQNMPEKKLFIYFITACSVHFISLSLKV
jgi:hypothetical protein